MEEFHSIISIKSFPYFVTFSLLLALMLHDGTIFSMGATSMLKNFPSDLIMLMLLQSFEVNFSIISIIHVIVWSLKNVLLRLEFSI